MGISRVAHLEIGVADIELCAAYYVEIIGMIESENEPGRVFLKCWDEADHHSLILTEGESGLKHLAFKLDEAGDLEEFEAKLRDAGVPVERVPAQKEPGRGKALRFESPGGHVLELVCEVEQVGGLLPETNPPPYPPGLVGVHPPYLDRIYLTAEEVGDTVEFFTEKLGFRLTERAVSDGGDLLAAWLTSEHSRSACEVAVVSGASGGLHHFAFHVEDRTEVLRAADVLTANGLHIESGPSRSGATRALSVDFMDPAGNGNAVYSGGYRAEPGMKPVTWTEEQFGRAFFQAQPALYAGFLQARG